MAIKKTGSFTKDTAAAYLAAMIDGEGTVGYQSDGRHSIRRHVSIANTENSIIEACKKAAETLGIPYTVTVKKPQNPTHKECWNVNFDSREAFTMLNTLPLGSQLKKARIERLVKSYKHSQLTKEVIVSLYNDEELSIHAIAKKLGVKYGRIQHFMKTSGIEARQPGVIV